MLCVLCVLWLRVCPRCCVLCARCCVRLLCCCYWVRVRLLCSLFDSNKLGPGGGLCAAAIGLTAISLLLNSCMTCKGCCVWDRYNHDTLGEAMSRARSRAAAAAVGRPPVVTAVGAAPVASQPHPFTSGSGGYPPGHLLGPASADVVSHIAARGALFANHLAGELHRRGQPHGQPAFVYGSPGQANPPPAVDAAFSTSTTTTTYGWTAGGGGVGGGGGGAASVPSAPPMHTEPASHVHVSLDAAAAPGDVKSGAVPASLAPAGAAPLATGAPGHDDDAARVVQACTMVSEAVTSRDLVKAMRVSVCLYPTAKTVSVRMCWYMLVRGRPFTGTPLPSPSDSLYVAHAACIPHVRCCRLAAAARCAGSRRGCVAIPRAGYANLHRQESQARVRWGRLVGT